MPAFTLQSADGSTITPSSLKGQVYLITFFHTGCPDCQQELPIIQQLYDDWHESVTFLTIARNEKEEEIRSYWDANSLTMPFFAQDDATLYHLFANSGIPRIYLVNRKGIVIATYDDTTMPSYEQLTAIFSQL